MGLHRTSGNVLEQYIAERALRPAVNRRKLSLSTQYLTRGAGVPGSHPDGLGDVPSTDPQRIRVPRRRH